MVFSRSAVATDVDGGACCDSTDVVGAGDDTSDVIAAATCLVAVDDVVRRICVTSPI